jgi:16S rRNA G1207 methylase RsmC
MFERKDISKLKKDTILDVELLGSKFNLHTRWGVFSPRSIDDGTLLLMKYISADESDVCLDLGCGYGPIGLALARQCHKGQVHMVDKDFVAVELANDNAKRNGITNAKAYLSDAFIHVPSEIKFNQVISNIPAKVGESSSQSYFMMPMMPLILEAKLLLLQSMGLKTSLRVTLSQFLEIIKKSNRGRNILFRKL